MRRLAVVVGLCGALLVPSVAQASSASKPPEVSRAVRALPHPPGLYKRHDHHKAPPRGRSRKRRHGARSSQALAHTAASLDCGANYWEGCFPWLPPDNWVSGNTEVDWEHDDLPQFPKPTSCVQIALNCPTTGLGLFGRQPRVYPRNYTTFSSQGCLEGCQQIAVRWDWQRKSDGRKFPIMDWYWATVRRDGTYWSPWGINSDGTIWGTYGDYSIGWLASDTRQTRRDFQGAVSHLPKGDAYRLVFTVAWYVGGRATHVVNYPVAILQSLGWLHWGVAGQADGVHY